MSNNIVSTTQLAKKLGVSRQLVYNWRKKGLPVVIHLGRTIRYDWEDVLSWLKAEGVRVETDG